MPGAGCVATEFIRRATPQDADALVDIYIECFPERVDEVFGGAHRRTFIRDYLRFYLSWDPMNNWVYVSEGAIVGFILAPCRYSPWRAVFSQGQLFRWIGHFLRGAYGLPFHLVKQFFGGGFAFASDAAIKSLWGKPYIHLIAVKAAVRGRRSGVSPGIQLVRWALDEHRKKGIRCWWAVVPPANSRFIPFWKWMGFRFSELSGGRYLAVLSEPDADLRDSER
jgi:hypothetical protein